MELFCSNILTLRMGIKGFRKSAEVWHDSDVGLSLAVQIYCASTMLLDLDVIFFFNVLEATVFSCLAVLLVGKKDKRCIGLRSVEVLSVTSSACEKQDPKSFAEATGFVGITCHFPKKNSPLQARTKEKWVRDGLGIPSHCKLSHIQCFSSAKQA